MFSASEKYKSKTRFMGKTRNKDDKTRGRLGRHFCLVVVSVSSPKAAVLMHFGATRLIRAPRSSNRSQTQTPQPQRPVWLWCLCLAPIAAARCSDEACSAEMHQHCGFRTGDRHHN